MLGDGVLEFLLVGTRKLVDERLLLEELESGDGAHTCAVVGGNFVNVEVKEGHTGRGGRQLLVKGSDLFARSAPLGTEVHDDKTILGSANLIVLGGRGDVDNARLLDGRCVLDHGG